MAVGSFPPCIPRINMTKFFCCDLRSGSLFLGYLSMISSLISILFITIYTPIRFMEVIDPSPSDKWKLFFIIIICDVILGLIMLINYMMIQGVKKYKPSLMYPWIYTYFVFLILSTVISILVIIMSIYYMINYPISSVILQSSSSIVQMIVSSAFNFYCFGTVVSYCQKIIQDNSLTQHQTLQNENL
ncbi:uncharacterized protein LOC122847828 [Aphidius gifuensis]|uniref:uncharacterized protein LOC122847828 n=1 Tax=Aphidius gifuensis TaxID=684658 RepID=UPI001CDCDC2C|nr:uncharacterized protein LOC122847828 [Aphidius gifuensis]